MSESRVFPNFSRLTHPSQMTEEIKIVDKNKIHVFQKESFLYLEPTDYQVKKQL